MSVAIGQVSSSAHELPLQPSPTILPSAKLPSTATAIAHDTNQTFDNTDEGAILREVLADTPASRAGLRPGDGIVTLNDYRIRTAHDFTDRLDRIPAHTTIQLGVVRGRGPQRQRTSVSLRTASRPETARLAGTDSPPAASPPSSLTGISSAAVSVVPTPGVIPATQQPKPELQVHAPAAPPTTQRDESRSTLPAQLSNDSRN